MSEVAQNTAEVKVKPLSDNAFIAFFQKIWRWWLGVWYGFADKHPKGAAILYKVFFFIVFSEGVTIVQLLIMLFLPKAFAALDFAFAWPGIQMGDMTWNKPIFDAAGNLTGEYIANSPVSFAIFGDEVLGNWIAFEIAVFIAQCINFPLQRNITYKSKGNPAWQAMWYFIGWVGISILTGAVWGIINPFLQSWGWFYTVDPASGLLVENGFLYTIATLIKTVITGGLSMVIFFPIFIIIFPDLEKMAKNAAKKVEKLKEAGASEEKIAAAEAKADELAQRAKVDTARKEEISANSLANAKAVSWEASKNLLEKMKAENKSAEDIENQEKIVADKYQQAVEAAEKRDEAIAAYAALRA